MTCLVTRRGQSMVELSFVVLAVIAGVILGGPYLLDSLNSHFKLWDSAVADSHNDRLIKANKGDLDLPDAECTLVSKAPGTCKAAACKDNVQYETLRYYTHQFDPAGCQVKYSCEPDDKCCSEPVATSDCWRELDPANSNGTRKWLEAIYLSDELKSQGFRACGPTGANCKNGDQLYMMSCGSHRNEYVALANPDKCMPRCRTEDTPTNATLCPGQGVPELMKDSKSPELLYSTQPCSSDPGECQARCADNYRPSGTECAEICRTVDEVHEVNGYAGSGVVVQKTFEYDKPVQFIVDLFSEDFNYQYRIDNGPLHTNGYCLGPGYLFLGMKDEPDGTIQHLQFTTALARKLWVYVQEGGKSGSGQTGYRVTIKRGCTEEEVPPVGPHADYGYVFPENPRPDCPGCDCVKETCADADKTVCSWNNDSGTVCTCDPKKTTPNPNYYCPDACTYNTGGTNVNNDYGNN